MNTIQFRIEGMHCVDCAHKVEEALSHVPGVDQVRVHYLKKLATVEWSGSAPPSEEILTTAVANAGYRAIPRPS
jgi:copper chaperone CopZ